MRSVEEAVKVEASHFKTVTFGDFQIACASRSDLVSLALTDCNNERPQPRLVFDANGHALSLARTNALYATLVAQADLIHADGGFLVTLSRWLGLNAIPERSATTDMLHDFSQAFEGTPYSFYLLGSDEQVNSKCSDVLQRAYPTLNLAGRRNGFFASDEEEQIVSDINQSGADILWVGLGKPKEQEFCIRWRASLKVRWIITCGGCYNYVTGDYPRAPQWMQDWNVEWVHRLCTRPRALFMRYFITTPHALWIALTSHSRRDQKHLDTQ
ncbi:WecB/TagA/CpsF family glycosyltransferase [Stenotrophomonas sp. NPDC078853]|uniref:WecB/TagA/CpsF family glycosyltransferase n=1 Tax=Stenotrophomonas sp. NPDC078853 TaxID=3364534 RepID=UPI00385001AD